MDTKYNLSLEDSINLSAITEAQTSIEEAKKKLSTEQQKMSHAQKHFFLNLLKDCYDFSKINTVMVPIGNNNFIVSPKLIKNYRSTEYIISGDSGTYQDGKLTVSNRNIEITLNEWIALPENIKKQDIDSLTENKNTVKYLNGSIFGYKKAQSIIEVGDFQLVICKERYLSSFEVPKQLFIYCNNPDNPENQKKLNTALGLTAQTSNPVLNGSSQPIHCSQILSENVIASTKQLKAHESLLIHIFGEDVISQCEKNIAHYRSLKITGSKTQLHNKPDKTTVEKTSIMSIKL